MTHLPGAKLSSKNSKTILECFSSFIDQEIILTLVNYTNIKIQKYTEKNKNDCSAYKTDDAEMKAARSLLILAGSVKLGHQNLSKL